MNEKTYKKRLDFQQKMTSRQYEQIESLKLEIDKLKLELEEKDKIIDSIEPIRAEMIESIKEHKRLKEQYKSYIQELKNMKEILDKIVYKGRWRLVKFLIK